MAFGDRDHPSYSPDPDPDAEGLRLPPWRKYPNIPRGSIGWRMGFGEEHWDEFYEWWLLQPEETRTRIRVKYPEPPEWAGFYRVLDGGDWDYPPR